MKEYVKIVTNDVRRGAYVNYAVAMLPHVIMRSGELVGGGELVNGELPFARRGHDAPTKATIAKSEASADDLSISELASRLWCSTPGRYLGHGVYGMTFLFESIGSNRRRGKRFIVKIAVQKAAAVYERDSIDRVYTKMLTEVPTVTLIRVIKLVECLAKNLHNNVQQEVKTRMYKPARSEVVRIVAERGMSKDTMKYISDRVSFYKAGLVDDFDRLKCWMLITNNVGFQTLYDFEVEVDRGGRNRFSVEEARHVVFQLCAFIAKLNGVAKISHGDIHSNNVVVREYTEQTDLVYSFDDFTAAFRPKYLAFFIDYGLARRYTTSHLDADGLWYNIFERSMLFSSLPPMPVSAFIKIDSKGKTFDVNDPYLDLRPRNKPPMIFSVARALRCGFFDDMIRRH